MKWKLSGRKGFKAVPQIMNPLLGSHSSSVRFLLIIWLMPAILPIPTVCGIFGYKQAYYELIWKTIVRIGYTTHSERSDEFWLHGFNFS